MEPAQLPESIIALTWDRHRFPARERLLTATLSRSGASYVAGEPTALDPGARTRVLEGLRPPRGWVLLGLDAPLGVPQEWAERVAMPDFRTGLARFGTAPGWQDFYLPSDEPSLRRPFAPLAPDSKMTRGELAKRLGFEHDRQLLRRCDRRSTRRNAPQAGFYVRYVPRNGRSAIAAWCFMIGPAIDDVALWPFDGPLGELAGQRPVVVAEILPWEAQAHLGVDPRRPQDPQRWQRLREALRANRVTHPGWEPKTRADFDALASLASLVAVARGTRPEFVPEDELCRKVEGWILGLDPADLPTPRPRASVARSGTRSGEERYAVRHLTLISSDGTAPVTGDTVELAQPSATRGAINVICGLNNAGKSYMLDQLWRVLKGKPHRNAFTVDPLPRGQPHVLYLGETWNAKDKIGLVNLDQSIAALNLEGRQGDLRRSALAMLLAQMSRHLDLGGPAELAARAADADVREQIAGRFAVQDRIYRCDPGDALVAAIERIIGGRLYFRCTRRKPKGAAWDFEFVLLYEDGSSYPYGAWSEGQKSCFYILTSLHYFDPDILLFDEVENHLHPAYMSEVLEILRERPTQSIVATHHPHLIFSRFADLVFYVDTVRPGSPRYPPDVAEFRPPRHHLGFPRTLTAVGDDFDRVTKAYRLFADQDDQLLRQASYLRTRAALTLLEALSSAFAPVVAKPSPKPLPDTQSQQLAERIGSAARSARLDEVAVLDLGAGIGRQVDEIAKLSRWQLGAVARWTLLELFAEQRETLESRFGDDPSVEVVGTFDALDGRAFDLVVLANVLHELNPDEFSAFMHVASGVVARPDGAVVILDLYPLLEAETFAVPYEPADVGTILQRCGWQVAVERISLRQRGVTAYCAIGRPPDPPPAPTVVAGVVSDVWDGIEARALAAYALGDRPDNMGSYLRTLSELTTIASIAAWRAGRWHSSAQLQGG